MYNVSTATNTKSKVNDIRKELLLHFPNIDFRIFSTKNETSEKISVSYYDGVCKARLLHVIKPFLHSYFIQGKEIKIVLEIQRNMSSKAVQILISEFQDIFPDSKELGLDDICPQINMMLRDYINKVFIHKDFK